MTQGDVFDVFIIGGGISGAAIAAECSGRQLSVAVCDQGDVGGASSSQSDQILPGAIHFLRNHNLPYFNKVIKEKALLKKRAPHLYQERLFVVVPESGAPPSLISRMWLWLFHNWLQGKSNARETKRQADKQQLAPLRLHSHQPWVTEESMVDDARLVIENLLLAEQRNSLILPRHEFVHAHRQQGRWQIQLRDAAGKEHALQSHCLINAAGVKVNDVQNRIENSESRCWIQLKRKLFLIIPKFYRGDHAYLLESKSGTISVTPYQEHYCLVSRITGVTTDTTAATPVGEECTQLVAALNKRFNSQLDTSAILKCYCIQQPVYSDDYKAAPEGVDDYVLDLSCTDGRSPLVSVFGGSFATHRTMAEETVEMLGQYVDLHSHPSTIAPLPGGDLDPAAFDQFILHVASHYPWLPSHLLNHYCRTYGARVLQLLDPCKTLSDLGQAICPGLHEREAEFLLKNEWVSSAEDILWRRTRLGLYTDPKDIERLQGWLEQHLRSPSGRQAYTIKFNSVTSGQMH